MVAAEKISGIAVDFRRIGRVSSGLGHLRDYLVNLSAFEEKSIYGWSNEVSNEIHHRFEDPCLVFLKSIPLSEYVERVPNGE
jgi:hypothetical protein